MKKDTRKEITEKIIKMMEESNSVVDLPWYRSGMNLMPFNGKSKRRYNGINVFILWAENKSTPEWRTFKQWKEAGANVRKGEKGTAIVFWKPMTGKKEDATGDESSYRWMLCKTYYVFNADQVDGYEFPVAIAPVELSDDERNKNLDAWIKRTLATIKETGERACYIPIKDEINMPSFKLFKDSDSFYTTLLHELTHWTGHKDRMDRDMSNRFGSEGYAMEELVAEMGSVFLASHLNISASPREDHAQYLNNWIKVIKDDPNAIFTAATAADRAAQFIIDRVEGKQEKVSAA